MVIRSWSDKCKKKNYVSLKGTNLLIQISNTMDKNIELKVLETLKDSTTSRLLVKMFCSRCIFFIIKQNKYIIHAKTI